MKRFLFFILILTITFTAWAQNDDVLSFGPIKDALDVIIENMASSLLTNASIGNQWSDAYIGKFPHLGIGTSVGVVTIPIANNIDVMEEFGLDDEMLSIVEMAGIPFPVMSSSLRLGGFIFPFDAGLKIAYIDKLPGFLESPDADIDLNYKLFGADIRYALIEEKGFLPDISVGVGINYLSGLFSAPFGDMDFGDLLEAIDEINTVITVLPPRMNFEWEATALDITAQLSKRLLFIRPYLGAGLAIGKSSAATSIRASVTSGFDDLKSEIESLLGSNPDEELKEILDMVMEMLDQYEDSLGFEIASVSTKPEFRVYGGFSLDIFALMLDLQVMYLPGNKSFGANLGVRLQF